MLRNSGVIYASTSNDAARKARFILNQYIIRRSRSLPASSTLSSATSATNFDPSCGRTFKAFPAFPFCRFPLGGGYAWSGVEVMLSAILEANGKKQRRHLGAGKQKVQ